MHTKISDLILALSCGIITVLSFPKFNLSFFCWISLIPLLFIILEKSPKQSFLLGLLAGFSFYATLIYWIPSVPSHYGGISVGLSFIIYIIFALFLALFWAFFSFLSSIINKFYPKLVFLVIPFLWVSFEYILTHFLTGFPWGLLGYTQTKNIFFIQLASITGVYGLSFILVFFQSMFVFSMKFRKKSPFLLALTLILIIHIIGYINLKNIEPSRKSFSASVIQGNVSSDIYWDKISYDKIFSIFKQHLDLSRQGYTQGAQLIIWPEFSVPLCFSCPYGIYQEFQKSLLGFVKNTGCTLVLGTNEIKETQTNVSYYNTALCLSPNLSMTHYYKMHLVPFGEYTPYKKIFSFIEKMTHAIGDVTPGNEYTLHEFNGMKFGSPICYEIIFPDLVRKFTKKGANFLVTITNDGWYGKTSAPYQHFSIAVMRAVENRRFLLRAATTGISGIIDPYGRILSKSSLETKDILIDVITPLNGLTFYSRYGDVLPWISLTLCILFLILTLKKRRN